MKVIWNYDAAPELERSLGAVSFQESKLSFELGPYEIKSFRLKFNRASLNQAMSE